MLQSHELVGKSPPTADPAIRLLLFWTKLPLNGPLSYETLFIGSLNAFYK